MKELHTKFKWLLFFRIPKLMCLCKLIDQFEECDHTDISHRVLQEIGFLMQRMNRSELKYAVQDIEVIVICVMIKSRSILITFLCSKESLK